MTLTGFPRIAIDPAVCGGRPTVRGTRMRVSDVLEMLAGGATSAEIAGDFPYLSDDDVRAVLAYAAGLADQPVVTRRRMKFLIDAQLPPALCRWLASAGMMPCMSSEVGLLRRATCGYRSTRGGRGRGARQQG